MKLVNKILKLRSMELDESIKCPSTLLTRKNHQKSKDVRKKQTNKG